MAAVQEQASAVEQLRAAVGRLEQRSDTIAQALQVGTACGQWEVGR